MPPKSLLTVLLKIFPAFANVSKENRNLTLKVLKDKYQIIDFHDGSRRPPDSDYIRQFPFEATGNYRNSCWMVVKFTGVKLRARLVHKVPDIYACIIRTSGTPYLLLYNELCSLERWQNDSTVGKFRFEYAVHPHIAGSEPCTGAHSTYFSRTSADGAVIGYLESVRNFLSSWNNRSRYFHLNSFRAYTGKYKRKAIISSWNMCVLHMVIGEPWRGFGQDYNAVVAELYLNLIKRGLFQREACLLIRTLIQSINWAEYTSVSDNLISETHELDDYNLLEKWYNSNYCHRRQKVTEIRQHIITKVYYNYQDFLYEKVRTHVRRVLNESGSSQRLNEENIDDFTQMAIPLWKSGGGYVACKSGNMDMRYIQGQFRDYFEMNVDFNYGEVYKAIDPINLYGKDGFGHDLVAKLHTKARMECCLAAYEETKNSQKEIIDEIRTIEEGSGEDRVFQQILQF